MKYSTQTSSIRYCSAFLQTLRSVFPCSCKCASIHEDLRYEYERSGTGYVTACAYPSVVEPLKVAL